MNCTTCLFNRVKVPLFEPLLKWDSSTQAIFDQLMSAFGGKADIIPKFEDVRFVLILLKNSKI
jgi:hypothetical protein